MNLPVEQTRTYCGCVRSTADACFLFEAILQDALPLSGRLDSFKTVVSGDIYIYKGGSDGIKRWNDNTSWSASRSLGDFLIYCEINGEKKMIPKADRTNKDNSYQGNINLDEELSLIGSLNDTYYCKVDGLVKKKINLNYEDQLYSLISYYALKDVPGLMRPSQDPRLNRFLPRKKLFTNYGEIPPTEYAIMGQPGPHGGGNYALNPHITNAILVPPLSGTQMPTQPDHPRQPLPNSICVHNPSVYYEVPRAESRYEMLDQTDPRQDNPNEGLSNIWSLKNLSLRTALDLPPELRDTKQILLGALLNPDDCVKRIFSEWPSQGVQWKDGKVPHRFISQWNSEAKRQVSQGHLYSQSFWGPNVLFRLVFVSADLSWEAVEQLSSQLLGVEGFLQDPSGFCETCSGMLLYNPQYLHMPGEVMWEVLGEGPVEVDIRD